MTQKGSGELFHPEGPADNHRVWTVPAVPVEHQQLSYGEETESQSCLDPKGRTRSHLSM